FICIVLSFAVALLGATIPGFLQIGFQGGGLAVRAGGALALFFLTFFYTPKVLHNVAPTTSHAERLEQNLSGEIADTLKLLDELPRNPQNKKQDLPMLPDNISTRIVNITRSLHPYEIKDGKNNASIMVLSPLVVSF